MFPAQTVTCIGLRSGPSRFGGRSKGGALLVSAAGLTRLRCHLTAALRLRISWLRSPTFADQRHSAGTGHTSLESAWASRGGAGPESRRPAYRLELPGQPSGPGRSAGDNAGRGSAPRRSRRRGLLLPGATRSRPTGATRLARAGPRRTRYGSATIPSPRPTRRELETVQYILRRRRHGHASYRTIAAELTERRVPTKRGRVWHASTVRAIWSRRAAYRV